MLRRRRTTPLCQDARCRPLLELSARRMDDGQWSQAVAVVLKALRGAGGPVRVSTPLGAFTAQTAQHTPLLNEALSMLPGASRNDVQGEVGERTPAHNEKVSSYIRPAVRALKVCSHEPGHVRTTTVRSRGPVLVGDAVAAAARHDVLFAGAGTSSPPHRTRHDDELFKVYLGATPAQRDLWAAFSPPSMRASHRLRVHQQLTHAGLWSLDPGVQELLTAIGPDTSLDIERRLSVHTLSELLACVRAAAAE